MQIQMERTTASVIAFILGNLPEGWIPVYQTLPEGFGRPTVYFPVPETEWLPGSLEQYTRLYVMYVMFFGTDARMAHAAAMEADSAIKYMRGLVPRIDTDGGPTDEYVRMRMQDQRTRVVDADMATVQLAVSWTEPLQFYRPEAVKMEKFDIAMYPKGIRDADRESGPFLLPVKEVAKDGGKEDGG